MSLRRWSIVYLAVLHVALAYCSFVFLRNNPNWLYAVEGGLAMSVIGAVILYRRIFHPPDVLLTGTEFLREQDYGSRFRTVGHPEVDQLITLYNSMAQNLQEERIHLQEQQYFLGKLIDATPAGVITCDLDRKIDVINPAAEQILGVKAEEVVGKGLDELDVRLAEECAQLPVRSSTVLHHHGRRQIKCWKLQFMDRGFAREFVLLEELTEELRRTEKASYEKLIRLMSHEVNNSIGAANSLLNSCLSYANQIAPADRIDFEEALRVAITRTQHLSDFVRVYADLVRLPAPQRQPYDVGSLLANVVRLFSPELARRAIRVEWLSPPTVCLVAMDIAQMEQVFTNILKNAIEAIDREGTIALTIGGGDGKRCVYIDDTGPGVSQEQVGQLFTPFYSTKPEGQGIGLTLAAEVLSQHGFAFAIESAGERTRFRISFD